MNIEAIVDSIRYVVDRDGQRTAVLLNMPTWNTICLLLDEIDEDEQLGRLMDVVGSDETLEGEAAWSFYQSSLHKTQP